MSNTFKIAALILSLIAAVLLYNIFSADRTSKLAHHNLPIEPAENEVSLNSQPEQSDNANPEMEARAVQIEPKKAIDEVRDVAADDTITSDDDLSPEMREELMLEVWSEEKIEELRAKAAKAEEEFFGSDDGQLSPEKLARLEQLKASGDEAERKYFLDQQGENIDYDPDREQQMERLKSIGNEAEKDLVIEE